MTVKTAKVTGGKAPSKGMDKKGAYAHKAHGFTSNPGQGPVVQNWPAESGTPRRVGKMPGPKSGSENGGY